MADFEDRGKETSTNDSGGIYYFGNVAEEQVVCSPLKRRRIFEPVPAPPDGLPRPPSAPWTRLASSSSSPSARPYQWPPTNMSPGARRRRPPSTPTWLRRATPPTVSKEFSSSSSERNIGTRWPSRKGTTHGTRTSLVCTGRGSLWDKPQFADGQTSVTYLSRSVKSMAGSNCTNHAELPLEAQPLQADDAECQGVEGHRHLRPGLPAQDDSSDMLFGSYTTISQPEASEKADNIKETQTLTLYKEGGNIIEEEAKKKEEEALSKEERRKSGRINTFISIFQKSNNLEPYLHVPGPQTVPGGPCTRSGSGTAATSSSSWGCAAGRSSSTQEGIKGAGGGTGSLQEALISSSSRGRIISSLCGTKLSRRAPEHSQLFGITRGGKTTGVLAPEHLLTNERPAMSLICGTVLGLVEKETSSRITIPGELGRSKEYPTKTTQHHLG